MKKLIFTLCLLVLLAFSGMNETLGQWTTSFGGSGLLNDTNGTKTIVSEPRSGVNGLYINNAGQVGIGTTTPAASFHVAESSPGFTGVFGTPISTWNTSTNVSIGDDNGFSILYLGQSDPYKGFVYWNYWDPGLFAFLGIGTSNIVNPLILQPFGGKVGINCYPSADLHLSVSGYDAYAGLMITNTRTGGKSLTINQGTLGKLNFTDPGVIDLVTMDFNTQNVGIGITTPATSAALDISSTNKGLLIPRMTLSQIQSIMAPADGLQVYCTTEGKMYIFNAAGNQWKDVAFGPGNISACGNSITKNHVAGYVAAVTKTVTYGTVTNIPGEPTKCWITSNLGADHQATAMVDATEASAGWYWQFNKMQGYKHDGTTRTPNTTWITSIVENYSSWQYANDPCTLELGYGWRIPSYTEWYNVLTAGGWIDGNGPWNSALKLHFAGFLYSELGDLYARDGYITDQGQYWSNSYYNDSQGMNLYFYDELCFINYYHPKATGMSIRCIRD